MLRKMADQNPDDYTPEANLHHPDYGGDKYEASPPATGAECSGLARQF